MNLMPPRVRWNKRALKKLDGKTLAAVSKLAELVKERPAKRPALGGLAWGQYLDFDRYIADHWGRYGTSAAVQVLHVEHERTQRDGRVVDREPLRRMADVLPRHVPTDWPPTFKPTDLNRVLKLGAWVEALDPDSAEIRSPLPGIVEHLLDQCVDPEGWSSRPAGTEARERRDRFLPTAYLLHALRRFPDALVDSRIDQAHTWLAGQLSADDIDRLSPDLVALCGLALRSAPPSKRGRPEVRAAIGRVDRRLRDFALASSQPRIDRPHFHGFNEGDTNDYLFLSPELLTSLYFLRGDNPAFGRVFVLRVVNAVADNILDEVAAGAAGDMRGFRVQGSSMMGTVDQMWAARVLFDYHARFEANAASLRPPRVPRARVRPGRLVQGGVGVLIMLAGGALTKIVDPLLGIPVVALGAVATVVVAIGRHLFGRAVQPRRDEERH
jgi:hypothetical protein